MSSAERNRYDGVGDDLVLVVAFALLLAVAGVLWFEAVAPSTVAWEPLHDWPALRGSVAPVPAAAALEASPSMATGGTSPAPSVLSLREAVPSSSQRPGASPGSSAARSHAP